jgi:peroxiredoxin
MITEGKKAPDFTLSDQDGARSRWGVVLEALG